MPNKVLPSFNYENIQRHFKLKKNQYNLNNGKMHQCITLVKILEQFHHHIYRESPCALPSESLSSANTVLITGSKRILIHCLTIIHNNVLKNTIYV